MLLMSLEEGKPRRDLEQEGWVEMGVGRKEYLHLSLKTTSPDMPCATGTSAHALRDWRAGGKFTESRIKNVPSIFCGP